MTQTPFTAKVKCVSGNIIYAGTQFRVRAKCNFVNSLAYGPWEYLSFGTSETWCATGVAWVSFEAR